MRGEMATGAGEMQRAALLMDLYAAGVRAEMGEALYPWFTDKAAKKSDVVVMAAPAAAPAVRPTEMVREGAKVVALLPRKEESRPEPVRVVQAPGAVPARVWREGEAGGLVVVVQGDKPLAGKQLELLQRMLAAVGAEDALAWVGVEGKVEAAALAAEISALTPARTLILGQGVLGMLVGRNQGVEGWQASPAALQGCGACTGVTYPPDLLLMQPLFKRLAWQHLLAWKGTWA